MYVIEPHFLAILNASQSALSLIQLLPETDLVSEIEEILKSQISIGMGLIHNKKVSPKKLQNFIDYTENVMDWVDHHETQKAVKKLESKQ